MIAVAEAREIIDRKVGSLGVETASLTAVHGRVLREDVAAGEDMPPFDRSAMDGYAVRADDPGEEFAVRGEIRAGDAVTREIVPGEAVRIFTGAQMPREGLKVIMQEHTEAVGPRIRLLRKSAMANVRYRGEDARAGEILLRAGTTLDAAAVALLAAMGRTSILASKRPSVLHVTTGDEIVPPGTVPKEGQIRNSNAFLIPSLCREQGLEEVTHLHSGDDLDAMLKLLAEVKGEKYDMVLVSGGSGGGAYDFTAKVFEKLGATLHFRQVNVRPGKPLIFGTNSSQVLFGLPGNALSHYVCFHLFVRCALNSLLGRPASGVTKGILAEQLADAFNDRETWWPARMSLAEGRIECHALPWKSSGDITRLPSANALIRVPASTPALPAEAMVELLITRSDWR
ncbi:MAG TPA: molybdopterin molybdotransferase MoeA [Candidatus Methylacidiphilales bacterium]|nr:molybdopterin molybdotransferase MoeA [Candidatus Methylacidiphilales bacterium]